MANFLPHSGFRSRSINDPTLLLGGYCYSTLFDGTAPQRSVTLYLAGDPPRLNAFQPPSPSTIVLTAASPVIASYTPLVRVARQVVGPAAGNSNGASPIPLTLSIIRATLLEVRYQHLPTASKEPESGTRENGSDNNTSGLSTGAKVGIAVGVVVLVLFVAVALFLLWRRRRKARLHQLQHPTLPEMHDTQRFEKDGKDVIFAPAVAYELDGEHTPVGAHELPVSPAPLVVSPPVMVDSLPPRTMAAPWEAEPDPVPVHAPAVSPEPTTQDPHGEFPMPAASGSEPMSKEKLDLLQKELQRVKQQRERLQQLQQLESRETELERLIEQELQRRS